MEYKTTLRITSLVLAVLVVLGIFVGRLYQVQINKSEEASASTDSYTFLTQVPAATSWTGTAPSWSRTGPATT